MRERSIWSMKKRLQTRSQNTLTAIIVHVWSWMPSERSKTQPNVVHFERDTNVER